MKRVFFTKLKFFKGLLGFIANIASRIMDNYEWKLFSFALVPVNLRTHNFEQISTNGQNSTRYEARFFVWWDKLSGGAKLGGHIASWGKMEVILLHGANCLAEQIV